MSKQSSEASQLLLKLNRSHNILQKLNKDIESRPFSTRLHGHFDKELKKSQSIIAKLSALLRQYHSFQFSSDLSLEIKENNTVSSKLIDQSFIIDFKDICLKIEREWRIGTKLIQDFQSKYPNHTDSDHYYSDGNNDQRYKHTKKYKHISNINKDSKSSSQSPIHSFSNPNSPLFSPNKMSKSVTLKSNKKNNKIPALNIGISQSQILQKQPWMQEAEYNAQIGEDFIPYDEEQKLNKQIRGINEDLQYLLDINKQVNDLVRDQSTNVDDIERKVGDVKDNIEQGTNTLTSIRKSPVTYAMFGGIVMAALGAPIILVGAGVKAAIGGSIGLGTVGALTGKIYANKVNDKLDKENENDKKQKLLLDEMENENEKKSIHMKGFKTKPKKRRVNSDKQSNMSSISSYIYGGNNDDDDIDTWDARN